MRGWRKLRGLLLAVLMICLLAVTASAAETKVIQSGGYELLLTLLEDGTWSVRNNDSTGANHGDLVIPPEVDGRPVTVIETSAFENDQITGSVTLPETLKEIGIGAFDGCTSLTGSLYIPDSVESIQKDAFKNCTGLMGNLTLPNHLTEISSSAFMNCGFTGKLELPDELKKIRSSAFNGCSGFTGKLNLPGGLIEIGNGAFSGCSGFMGRLDLPEGLETLDNAAFQNCSGFTGTPYLPDSITNLGARVFLGCTGMSGVLCIPQGVTVIKQDSFRDCNMFSGLILQEGLIEIGSYAFYNCTSLTGPLEIPKSVEKIYDNAFGFCSGFTGELVLPDYMTGIGQYAFRGCSGLEGNLIIPNGITYLQYRVFEGCTGLNGIVKVPYSVTRIDPAVFDECPGIQAVYLPPGISYTGSNTAKPFSGCTGMKDVYYGGEENDFSWTKLGVRGTIHYNSYPAKELDISGSNLSYRVGQTVTLEATYAADEIAKDLTFAWSSSHPEVAELIDSAVEVRGKGYAAKVTATFKILKESSSEITVSGPFGLFDTCVVTADDLKELTFVPRSGQSMTETNVMEPGETMELVFSYRSYSPVAEDLDDFIWKTLVNGAENDTVVSLSNVKVQADDDYAATLTATVTAIGFGGPVDIVVSGPRDCSAKCTVVVPQDKLTILGENQAKPDGVLTLREATTNPFTLYVQYETQRSAEEVEKAIRSMVWTSSAPDFFGCAKGTHTIGTEKKFTPDVTWEQTAEGVYLLQTELTPALEGVTALKIETAADETSLSTSDVCLVYASFDVDSYLAELYEGTMEDGTRFPEAERLDQYLYELDTPSQFIVEYLAKNDFAFIGSVAAWEAMEVIYNTVDNPVAAYMNYSVKESDIYYALLLELLRGTMEEYTDLAAVQVTEYGGSLVTNLQDAFLAAGQLDLTDSHVFSQWLMDNKETLNQNTFGEKMEIPGIIGDFMSAANVVTGTLNDYGQAMANAAVLEQVTDAMERVLEAMLAECPASAEDLQEALEKCLDQVRKTGEELRDDAELGLITSAGKRGYQAVFDKLWDELTMKIRFTDPNVAALSAAYAVGSTVCKEIGNTDDTVETYYRMLAMEDIREVTGKAAETLAWAWHQDPGGDTAAEYMCALDMLYRIQREDLELAQDAAQALIDAPEYECSGDPEQMDAALASFDEYGTSLDNYYNAFREMWMNYFSEDYPNALLDVQYEDLFADATGLRPTRVVVVACPVNVRVLDRSGNEVAYVGVDRISCAAEDISVALMGGEKHILFFGGSYTLQYEGYVEDTMTVTDRTFDSDGEVKQELQYYDLPVAAGQTYRSAQMGNLRDPGGSYVQPDSDSGDYAGYTVTVENGVLEIGGIPAVTAQAHEGQRITITASKTMGEKTFKGWKSNVEGVIVDPSSPVTTLRMPAKDVILTAEYGEDIAGPITLTDASGVELTTIPTGSLTAKVPAPETAEQCLLAGYDGAGKLVWIGKGTIEEDSCTFSVDNTKGEIAELRFFALTEAKAPAQGLVAFPKP